MEGRRTGKIGGEPRGLSAWILLIIPAASGIQMTLQAFSHLLPPGLPDIIGLVAVLLKLYFFLLVCALPMFVSWAAYQKIRGYAVGRVVGQGIRWGLLALITFAVTVAVEVSLDSYIPRRLTSGSYNERFSASVWQEPSSGAVKVEMSRRERMLGDLVDNVLPGKSRDDVLALLGQPEDPRSPYGRAFYRSESDLVYVLGRERDHGFNIDAEWLRIEFDGEGRYTSFRILTD